jgi:aminoglycoside phosphotransferase (APT) family kinase protein
MNIDLDKINQGLRRAFPEDGLLLPVSLIGEGFGSIAVETVGGVVFRIARTAEVGRHFAKEARVLPDMQPYLPNMIPRPRYYRASTPYFEHGVIGYRKLAGQPLDPAIAQRPEAARQIAGQVAAFLHDLHHVPLHTIAPAYDPTAIRLSWARWRDRVMPAITDFLTAEEYTKLEQWWRKLLEDDRLLGYEPTVIHGDLWFGNLLVDGRRLVGVIDFQHIAIGDPAQDFITQLYLGEEFMRMVLAAYRGLGKRRVANFEHRLAQLWAVREFSGLDWAVRHNDMAELQDGVEKLRRGPVLGGRGLDGWRARR